MTALPKSGLRRQLRQPQRIGFLLHDLPPLPRRQRLQQRSFREGAFVSGPILLRRWLPAAECAGHRPHTPTARMEMAALRHPRTRVQVEQRWVHHPEK